MSLDIGNANCENAVFEKDRHLSDFNRFEQEYAYFGTSGSGVNGPITFKLDPSLTSYTSVVTAYLETATGVDFAMDIFVPSCVLV